MKQITAFVLLMLLVPLPALARQPAAAVTHPPGAVIASAHNLATDAGIDIIRQGGNAFDAAVAVSSVLSVVEPISSGLGGGGFFLLHDGKTGKDVFVDARETAPAASTPAAYLDKDGGLDRDRAQTGPWSAGIPGLPAALVHVAEKYGRLPLGHDGFYRGVTAQRLLAGVKAEGGQWTAQELAAYQVKEREPLQFDYDGWKVTTAPPPSSGGIALAEMLQILAPWDLAKLPQAERVHLVAEAMRRAFRDRTFYLGDPDFVQIPVKTLTDPDYAAGLRATIHPDKATPSELLSGAPTPMEDEETTHFSIIDADGNRAAVTQTVNLLFGSGLVPPGTGVMLNDEMDDFALKPGTPNAFGVMGYDANAPAPGKRMLSSMTPTFMESADKVAVIGTPGGTRIITMVLLGMLGYADGLGAQPVAALPRYHHQWLPDVIETESGAIPAEVVAKLRAMGHVVDVPEDGDAAKNSSHTWGNMNTVMWDRRSNTLEGASDPRSPVGKSDVLLRP